MADQHTSEGEAAPPTGDGESTPPTGEGEAAPLTTEERLRALTSDRKRKVRGTGTTAGNPPATRPGDLVDAVRERSRDTGRDRPL
jgi:hypothetical protein